MAENVKFIGRRNSEEKAPEEEHFQHIKEIIHHLHKKKLSSVEDLLERIHDDWKSGKLSALADRDERKNEKFIKKFKSNEELTEEIKNMIQLVGRKVLSEDEIREAKERFGGARYSYGRDSLDPFIFRAKQQLDRVVLIKTLPLRDEDMRYGLEIHELAHYIHFFVIMKQLESGDIKDPVLKKLYGYLHETHDNEVILSMEDEYLGKEYRKKYYETVANALIRDMLHPSYKARNLRLIRLFGLYEQNIQAMANLLHYNPKEFRELMEKPSLSVGADYPKLADSLIKRESHA